MNINEYIPNGFNSWSSYYRHKKIVDAIKFWANGIFATAIFLGVYAFCGYVDTILFPDL